MVLMKRILVIAGTDSSGGAGLEADQKVIAAHGCYAMTAQAALTAQNTLTVHAIHEVPSDFVKKQIDACVEDIGVDVVKTGMLASASTVSLVAESLRRHKLRVSVIDPVMVATSGAQLLAEDAVKILCSELLPQTFILTPNIPEANLILKESGKPPVDVNNLEGLRRLALALHKLGPKYVLLKGGHMPLDSHGEVAKSEKQKAIIANVLVGDDVDEAIETPYQSSKNTHGTGCSLASAIACNLAEVLNVSKAVRASCRYVDAGIKTSPNFGKGSGPLNHFHSMQTLPFAPGHFVDFLLEHEFVRPAWSEYTKHDFVRQMGDGTLPPETFKYYMIQDYLYLIQFARANALAGYKTKSLDDIADVGSFNRLFSLVSFGSQASNKVKAATIVSHIRQEVNLHLKECEDFGLKKAEIEQYEESQACTAYSRYILDIGQSEDWLALQISLLPCLLGYHVIAKQLAEEQRSNPPAGENRYRRWIDNYTAQDYCDAVEKGCALVEKHAVRQSPIRIQELMQIFVHATKMETGFWNMAAGG